MRFDCFSESGRAIMAVVSGSFVGPCGRRIDTYFCPDNCSIEEACHAKFTEACERHAARTVATITLCS